MTAPIYKDADAAAKGRDKIVKNPQEHADAIAMARRMIFLGDSYDTLAFL